MSIALDPIIELEGGISVRFYRESDAPSSSKHGSNPNIKKALRSGFPHPYTPEDALAWRSRCMQPENLLGSGRWTEEHGSEGPKIPTHYAVCLNDEAIGSIGLVPRDNIYFRGAELGYWLSEEHWGKGIMSRAAKAFVEWTWDTFGVLVRLNSECDEDNPGSAGVLRKAGFTTVGLQEDNIYKYGKLQGSWIFGMLRPKGREAKAVEKN